MMMKRFAILMILGLAACAQERGVGFGMINPVETAPRQTTEQQGEAITLINAERAKHGLEGLSIDAALTRAAQKYANELATRNQLSHTGKSGSNLSDRLHAEGYKSCYASENLSKGAPTSATAVASWMTSPGHRANILSNQVGEIGYGTAPGNILVVVFGRKC